MKRTILALVLGAVLSGSLACVHRTAAEQAAEGAAPHTFVRVENQAFLDANIYVISGGSRQRLGTTSGIGSRTFELPRGIIFGSTPLSFLVDFIGSSRTPMSEVISVSPGDTVVLTIPPQ